MNDPQSNTLSKSNTKMNDQTNRTFFNHKTKQYIEQAGVSATCGLAAGMIAVLSTMIAVIEIEKNNGSSQSFINFLSSTMPLEASIALIGIGTAVVAGLLTFAGIQLHNKLNEEKAESNTTQVL